MKTSIGARLTLALVLSAVAAAIPATPSNSAYFENSFEFQNNSWGGARGKITNAGIDLWLRPTQKETVKQPFTINDVTPAIETATYDVIYRDLDDTVLKCQWQVYIEVKSMGWAGGSGGYQRCDANLQQGASSACVGTGAGYQGACAFTFKLNQ